MSSVFIMNELEVRQLIIDSKGLVDLEVKLEKRGLSFKSRKQLAKYLHNIWYRTYKEHFSPEILGRELPEKLDDLPTRVVHVDGIEFLLHSIYHGTPKNPCSDRYKEFIRACAKRYDNPPSEDYRVEGGFGNGGIFGLGKSIDEFANTVSRLTISEALRYWVDIEFKLLRGKFRIRKPTDDLSRIAKLTQEDERYLPQLQEIWEKGYQLPQPLDIKLSEYGGVWQKINTQRSKAIATMLHYEALRNNLNKMHGIMGMLHVPQVEYFLQRKLFVSCGPQYGPNHSFLMQIREAKNS